MATFTLQTLENEVAVHLGLDMTNSANVTMVLQWLNYVQQDICARWPWEFLRSQETFYSIIDESLGTVSINTNGTTVTGVSTNFINGSTWLSGASYGDIGNFIQFAGANDWYPVTSVASTTSLTVGIPYQGLTNLSGVTYTLRKIYYSLSANCDRIVDIVNWNSPLKLDELFPRDVDLVDPNPQSTATTYGFIPYGYDPVHNVRVIPYPYPSDARLFSVRTIQRPVDFVNLTDYPTVPNKWAHVIAFGAIAIGYARSNKVEFAGMWNNKFEQKILDMKAQERTSEDSAPILQSIDSGNRGENWLQMPYAYPQVPGKP